MNSDNTVLLRTTPAKLWPLLVEPENIRRWNPDVVSEEALTPGPPGVGSRSSVQIREGSRVVGYVSEVLTFEPEKLLVIQLTGGSLGAGPMVVSYSITPAEGYVTLRVQGQWQPVGLMLRLLAPLFGILGRRNSKAAMQRLQKIAEEDTSGSRPSGEAA